MELSHVEIAALAKSFDLKAVRDKLAPNKEGYDVDIMLRLVGKLFVGEDYERRDTVSIPLIRTLAAVCCLCGVTGPHAVKLIVKAIGMALISKGNKAEAVTRLHADVEAAISKVEGILERMLPMKPCKGQVKAKVEVTKVALVVEA